MNASRTEITKEWLADVLRTEISGIKARENPAFNSSVTHLEVAYTKEVNLPHKILVKLNKDHDGQNEIQFYRFTRNIPLAMVPQNLGMQYDAQSGNSFLILEDISKTHGPALTRQQLLSLNGVPAKEHMESIIDCIAKFHAAFWEHPQFGSLPDTTEMRWWYRDDTSHAKHTVRRNTEWSKFVDMYKKEVPEEWLEIGDLALKALPRLFEGKIKPRLSQKRALTMSQGDCYLTQFLVPQTGADRSFLIDFQDACVNFPAFDLVFMMATFWTRKQRAVHEEHFLHQYLFELNRQGVQYSWDQLCNDYRLCLSYMIFDGVWNAVSGSSREYWMPKLTCLFDAYKDWECAEL
jgi:hypothetical protein